MKSLVIVALLAGTAQADPPQLVVSVPLLALSSRGVAVEGEVPIASRLSVGLGLGLRDPASGDFGGYALALAVPVRGWLRRSQRGVHAVLRTETNLVHLRRPGMTLGTAYGLDASLGVGYRFVIKDRVAITPDLAFGTDIDFSHDGIPAQRRWTVFYGLAVGGRW